MQKDHPRHFNLSLWGIFLIFLFLKLSLYKHAEITYYGDERVFWDLASIPLSKAFFFSYRPFTVPLFYKFLGQNEWIIICFQIVLSVAGWFYFAIVFCQRIVTKWIQALSVVVLMLLSFSDQFSLWDMVIRSESIASSLFVLWLGLTLTLLSNQGKVSLFSATSFLFWMFITILFSFSRDNHVYILLVFGLLQGILWILPSFRKQMGVWLGVGILASLIGIALFQIYTIKVSERWMFSLQNIYLQRILPDDTKRNDFEKAGMPVTPELMALQGQSAQVFESAGASRPIKDFLRWFKSEGLLRYNRYLLGHPLQSWQEVIKHSRILIHQNLQYYGPIMTALSAELSRVFLPASRKIWIFFWICLILHVSFAVTPYRTPLWGLPFLLIVLGITQAFVCYHGDAMEVKRHALIVKMLFFLTFWTTFLLALDALWRFLTFLWQKDGLTFFVKIWKKSVSVLKMALIVFYTALIMLPIAPPVILEDIDFAHPPLTLKIEAGNFTLHETMFQNITPYAVLLLGYNTWRDYRVDVDFLDLYDGGIWVHALDEQNAMTLIIRPAYGDLYWQIRKNGKWETSFAPQPLTISSPLLRVRIEVKGNRYRAFINDQWISTITDETFSSGRVGVYFCCKTAQKIRRWNVQDLL